MDLFRHMNMDTMKVANDISVMTELKKRTPVYLPGDPADKLYLIKRGVVKIGTLTEEGKEIALAFLRPGDVFGELAVVDPSPRDDYAEVYEDALICIFARNEFLEFMKTYPDLAFRMTKLMGLRVRRLRNRVGNLLFKSAHARLAQTLLDLSQEYGVQDSAGVLLTLKLTQQELGSLVGLSRESVTSSDRGWSKPPGARSVSSPPKSWPPCSRNSAGMRPQAPVSNRGEDAVQRAQLHVHHRKSSQ